MLGEQIKERLPCSKGRDRFLPACWGFQSCGAPGTSEQGSCSSPLVLGLSVDKFWEACHPREVAAVPVCRGEAPATPTWPVMPPKGAPPAGLGEGPWGAREEGFWGPRSEILPGRIPRSWPVMTCPESGGAPRLLSAGGSWQSRRAACAQWAGGPCAPWSSRRGSRAPGQ